MVRIRFLAGFEQCLVTFNILHLEVGVYTCNLNVSHIIRLDSFYILPFSKMALC